jgi:uncharacterized membrane protein YfcA
MSFAVNPQDVASAISGGLVGFILAVVGGGGSILATPLLLYGVGVASPHIAIGTGAVAVAANAFANLISHARLGNVRWAPAAVFAATGVIGAFAGARLGKATDEKILLPLFALVMAAVGASMLRRRPEQAVKPAQLTAQTAPRLAATGVAVGLASGFFGIGGGFLVVPGLMAAGGLAITQAIGSSLLAVGAFGASTGASYALAGLVDWRVAAFFIGGGSVGGLIGMAVGKRLASNRTLLQRLFAGVVFAAAAYVMYRSLTG